MRISLRQMMFLFSAIASGCWIYSTTMPCRDGCGMEVIKRDFGHYYVVGYTTEYTMACPRCGTIMRREMGHSDDPNRHPDAKQASWRDRLLWELSADCPLRHLPR